MSNFNNNLQNDTIKNNSIKENTDLNFLEIASSNPRYLAVLMHGYGADNLNMLPIAEEISAFIPDIHFILPNGPFPVENYTSGKQWFSLEDRSEKSMLYGANKAEKILNSFLKAQLKRLNLDYNNLILMGFSQGAMMAIHTGLRLKEKIAAIVAYSGSIISWHNGILPFIEEKKDRVNCHSIISHDNSNINDVSGIQKTTDIKNATTNSIVNQKPHLLFIHGKDDDVIPSISSQTAYRKLRDHGFNCSILLENNLGHSISLKGIDETISFLQKTLMSNNI